MDVQVVGAHYYSYFPQPQSKMMWIQKNEHTQCVAAAAAAAAVDVVVGSSRTARTGTGCRTGAARMLVVTSSGELTHVSFLRHLMLR